MDLFEFADVPGLLVLAELASERASDPLTVRHGAAGKRTLAGLAFLATFWYSATFKIQLMVKSG